MDRNDCLLCFLDRNVLKKNSNDNKLCAEIMRSAWRNRRKYITVYPYGIFKKKINLPRPFFLETKRVVRGTVVTPSHRIPTATGRI